MKFYRVISVAITAVLLVCSCVKEAVFEPTLGDEQLIPLNIDGSIDQVATKATAAGFVDKDAVGLFAVNYLENNTLPGTLNATGNQADNVKYVFDEPNNKWNPVRPVYYKDINTNVDLYLYYPYTSSISDVNAANFEVKKDQSAAATATELSGYEASDWMWGKTENVTPSESRVQISLKHKLSAIQLTLNEGSGFGEGEFASLSKTVLVTNTTRKAQLDYATGGVTPVGNAQLDGIVMCPQTDGTFRAVVIPQTMAAGTQLFAITIDGISYYYTQTNPVEYQQGKQLSVTISINKRTPSGDYELELAASQIIDWTEDLNTHGGEARQYYVVNVTTPGTLGDLIAAAGKNPDKIKNLKVTGTISTADFYFMRDNMSILEAINLKEVKIINAQRTKTTSDLADDVIPYSAFSGKNTLYYFVFPDNISEICEDAFKGTKLTGSLILPDHITTIGNNAFNSVPISSLTLPSQLEVIGYGAFWFCEYLTGPLNLPQTLKRIEDRAFNSTRFTGHLVLPDNLEYIGTQAFGNWSVGKAGSYTGDLVIPENITQIQNETFKGCSFTGNLILNNVTSIETRAFAGCGFEGELVIPEGCLSISESAFSGCHFSGLVLPSSLKEIGNGAFGGSDLSLSELVFPEGFVSIGSSAFSGCHVTSLSLPSTLTFIGENAFNGCFYISRIVCSALEPPTVMSGAFSGVAKDNFTVEVPSQSVRKYQSESGWQDFKRIAAHYDFSISRNLMRALNASVSRTFFLRAPSGFSWSIQEKPDWVMIEPSTGTGKTDITVTIAEMTPADVATFEVNEGTFNQPSYRNFSGRGGEIVFLLEGKDYTCSMRVEQYDYAYPDGEVQTLYESSVGAGIDIVITGDGYDAKDIAEGKFLSDANAGFGHFFNLEPYKTYKDYFNVYAVIAMSDESGIGTVNTIKDSKFRSTFTQNRILLESQGEVFAWAKKADASMDLTKSLVILLQNTSTYEGVTYMYEDGSAIACCPVSSQAYPYDFRGIVQHEAGGHGFGKLGDEYIYHNAFIQTCDCICCDHPHGDSDVESSFGRMKARGWYKNLSMISDHNQVPWAHLIFNPDYSDYVDMYEGGYMHSRGVYRSEATSCMNNNIPYYSAISRQAIVERIMECAGLTFSLEDFYALDDDSFGTKSIGKYKDNNYGVDPRFNRATGHGPIFISGHPNVN